MGLPMGEGQAESKQNTNTEKKVELMVWSYRHKGSATIAVKVTSSIVMDKLRREILNYESLRAGEPYTVKFAMRSKANFNNGFL